MIKTRYEFFKRTHRDYVVVFLIKGKYRVFYEDKVMLESFKYRDIIESLDREHINYIIVDNLDVYKKQCFDDNRYILVRKKMLILDVLKR